MSRFHRVTIQAPYWLGEELRTAFRGRPHGVFLAGAVVEWLRGDDRTEVEAGQGVEPMARVTDGVLTGWVHRCCLELVPVRPQTALERLVGPDDL